MYKHGQPVRSARIHFLSAIENIRARAQLNVQQPVKRSEQREKYRYTGINDGPAIYNRPVVNAGAYVANDVCLMPANA